MKNRGFFLGRLLETKIARWLVRLGHFWWPFLSPDRFLVTKNLTSASLEKSWKFIIFWMAQKVEKPITRAPIFGKRVIFEPILSSKIDGFSWNFRFCHNSRKPRKCLYIKHLGGFSTFKISHFLIKIQSKIHTFLDISFLTIRRCLFHVFLDTLCFLGSPRGPVLVTFSTSTLFVVVGVGPKKHPKKRIGKKSKNDTHKCDFGSRSILPWGRRGVRRDKPSEGGFGAAFTSLKRPDIRP